MCAPTEAAEVSQCLPEGRERIYMAFPRQVGGKGNLEAAPRYPAVPVRAYARLFPLPEGDKSIAREALKALEGPCGCARDEPFLSP